MDAVTALKSLAFNANAEYKTGLIHGGVPRVLMMLLQEQARNLATHTHQPSPLTLNPNPRPHL